MQAGPRGVTGVLTAKPQRWKIGRGGRWRSTPRPASRPLLSTGLVPRATHGHVHTELAEVARHWEGVPAKEYRRGPLLALDLGAGIVHADVLPPDPQPLRCGRSGGLERRRPHGHCVGVVGAP